MQNRTRNNYSDQTLPHPCNVPTRELVRGHRPLVSRGALRPPGRAGPKGGHSASIFRYPPMSPAKPPVCDGDHTTLELLELQGVALCL
jgi:hypothetical protein